jgi:hypothetical protein
LISERKNLVKVTKVSVQVTEEDYFLEEENEDNSFDELIRQNMLNI